MHNHTKAPTPDLITNRDWLNKSVVDSISLTALLYPVPKFEKWLIRLIKDLPEEKLSNKELLELRQLMHEEAHHSVMHNKMNKVFDSLYKTGSLAWFVKIKIALIRFLPKQFQLAIAVVNETLVAEASKDILAGHPFFKSLEGNWHHCLKWHSEEEVDHSDVIHRTYKALGYNPLWKIPSGLIIGTSSVLLFHFTTARMIWKEKDLPFFQSIRHQYKAFWGKGGLFRRYFPTLKKVMFDR